MKVLHRVAAKYATRAENSNRSQNSFCVENLCKTAFGITPLKVKIIGNDSNESKLLSLRNFFSSSSSLALQPGVGFSLLHNMPPKPRLIRRFRDNNFFLVWGRQPQA
jgi:hypothetical protein